MGNILKIETDRLESDIKTIDSNIAALNACIARTELALTQLNSMWHGTAKFAFKLAANNDIREMRNVLKMITKYRDSLEQAKGIYDSAAASAEEMIKSIKI